MFGYDWCACQSYVLFHFAYLVISDKTEGRTKCVTVDDEDDCTFEFVLHETPESVMIYVDEDKSM